MLEVTLTAEVPFKVPIYRTFGTRGAFLSV